MTTLKISDLSVGDWVRCRGRNGRIERLEVIRYDERIRVAVESDLGTMYQFVGIEDIDPIPITAEMLEKNGFTRRSSEFPIYEYITLLGKMLRKTVVSLNHPYSYIACRIEDTSKELHEPDRITVGSSVDRNPIHIHDLQHALRLAGIDKEINL
jgi:hypothetical protein